MKALRTFGLKRKFMLSLSKAAFCLKSEGKHTLIAELKPASQASLVDKSYVFYIVKGHCPDKIAIQAMKALKNLGSLNFRVHAKEINGRHSVVQVLPSRDDCFSSCRPRTRSTVTIWNLPESVIINILHGMHIRDILSFRLAHPDFCDIVDNNSSIFANASFADSWPCEGNITHFIKAAERKNVEAAVKLAVAYLYREGLTAHDVSEASDKAAKYLCLAETLTPKIFPFFWIFIRPPWSPDGSCCKVQTFQRIKDLLENEKEIPDVMFGAALILKLQRLSVPEDSNSKLEEDKFFKTAVGQKSAAASFFSIMDVVIPEEMDKAKELEKVRLLRQIATSNILEAKLNLVKYYTQGHYGGISKETAQEYVRNFFSSSRPSGIHHTFKGGRTSDISRYILVDWLVEVVGMKDFSAHILYFAVSLFDRFVQVRKVQRSKVQLLGVAAIVVSSRFLGFDILTIREAAWLTDNSYTYHDVVRMMGELVAALGGNLRTFTIQDYMKVLLSLTKETGYSAMLIEYITMLCLLQSEMGQYSPAEIAASCMLLSRLLLNEAETWPSMLKEWTGFTQDYLSLCTFHIYNKCLLEGSEVEYRDTKLQSVKMRYADPFRFSVSNIEIVSHKELCRRLGVTKLVSRGKDTKAIKFRNTDELIMSPRRAMGADYCYSFLFEDIVDRNNAATPPIKNFCSQEELVSGYEGDMEDETDESFFDKSDVFYESNEDSDLDKSNPADAFDESIDIDEEGCQDYSTFERGGGLRVISPESPQNLNSSTKSEESLALGRVACLSSMCQSGTNLTCHSSQSSPSSCFSNCSCKRTYNYSVSDMGNGSAFASASRLSFSSPSLLYASTSLPSSSSSTLQQGNVRSCIPCGSISSTTKLSRKNRLSVSSSICDTVEKTDYDDSSCHLSRDGFVAPKEYFSLRKSRSSQDLTAKCFYSERNGTREGGKLSPNSSQVGNGGNNMSLQITENGLHRKITTYQGVSAACVSEHTHSGLSNVISSLDLLTVNKVQKSTDTISPHKLQISLYHEGSNFVKDISFTMKQTIASNNSTTESPLVFRSKTCSLVGQFSVQYLSEHPEMHVQSTGQLLKGFGENRVPSPQLFSRQSSCNKCVYPEDMLAPSTPESATALSQSNYWAKGTARDSENCSFSHATSAGYTSKRARLDPTLSAGFSDHTKQFRSCELQVCDWSNDSNMSDCSLTFCNECNSNDVKTEHSKQRKRKSCL